MALVWVRAEMGRDFNSPPHAAVIRAVRAIDRLCGGRGGRFLADAFVLTNHHGGAASTTEREVICVPVVLSNTGIPPSVV